MQGKGNIRFSDLFKDTVQAHGVQWAFSYYVKKRKMQLWEFRFWCRATIL